MTKAKEYVRGNVVEEVRKAMADLRDKNDSAGIPKEWVVQQVIQEHHPKNVGCFWRVAAHEGIARIVSAEYQAARAKDTDTSVDQPYLLGGDFKRLQLEYSVNRKGEQVLVRLDHMTDEEIIAKADEQDRMSEGCIKHRTELLRFLEGRKAARKEA